MSRAKPAVETADRTAAPPEAAAKSPLRRRLQWAARIVGFGVLGYLAYSSIDWATLARQLGALSAETLVLLLAIATLDRILMPLKWRHLMGALGPTPPVSQFLRIYYAASFLNYLLPSTIGGDVYRGYRMAAVADTHRVVASMVMERILGVFSTIAYAWLGLLLIGTSTHFAETRTVTYVLLAASMLLVAGFAASLHPKVHGLLERLSAKMPFGRPVQRLSRAYAEFGSRRGDVFVNFVFALFENGVRLALTYVCGLALGIDISPALFGAALAVSEFVRRASMVLDGWGLGTALYILTLGLVGITVTQALAITLLGHALVMAASLPGAVLVLMDRRQGLTLPDSTTPAGSETRGATP